MQYEIDVNGRTRQVSVARTGATFAVTVDGRTWQVDAARIDGHSLSLVVDRVWSKDTLRQAHEVVIAADRAVPGQLTVSVGSTPVIVAVNGRRRSGNRDDGHQGSGPERVTAPMPGKIVRVLVTRGETVTRRQPLIVVEAMKMENELRAGRDGTVAEMPVREGQSVDAGALLIVIQ